MSTGELVISCSKLCRGNCIVDILTISFPLVVSLLSIVFPDIDEPEDGACNFFPKPPCRFCSSLTDSYMDINMDIIII